MLHPTVARMKDPMLEVLLFKVGGASYGVALGQVVGVVHDLPPAAAEDADSFSEAQMLLFEGRDVPVFPASDLLHQTAPPTRKPREAIIFDDGRGLFGVAVDGTENVMGITPGVDLYALPPQEATDLYPCRPWAILTVAERPVILLDMSRVSVH